MNTILLLSIGCCVGILVLAYITAKMFRYKDIIAKIVDAAKDHVVDEKEFQSIIDSIKEEIWPK